VPTQLAGVGSSLYDAVAGTVSYVVRIAHKAETLLDETTEAVRATRRVVDTVGIALESALPLLTTIPDTQEDVRQAREAAEHLVGLVDTTLVQLDSLPGAKLVRRRMNRGTASTGPASLMP
jgi:hypothetical protein